MAKRLTITNTRPNPETPWFVAANSAQHVVVEEWLLVNSDKVTFQFDRVVGGTTQVLQYTFADEAIAQEFLSFVESESISNAMNDYHVSVGITSTREVTDV